MAESKHAKGGLRPGGRESKSDVMLFNWLLSDIKHDCSVSPDCSMRRETILRSSCLSGEGRKENLISLHFLVGCAGDS